MKSKAVILLIFSILCRFAVSQENVYSLDSCKALALQNNADLRTGQLEVEAARYVKNMAFTKYFPSLSAMGGGFKSNQNFMDADLENIDVNIDLGNGYFNDVATALSDVYAPYFQDVDVNMQAFDGGFFAGAMALQPIYAGGRIITGNRLAKLGIEASQYQLHLAEKAVLMKVEQSYWQIISLEEKRKTIETVNVLLDTLYKDVVGAVEAGLINRNDLLKVKLKQNEMKSNLMRVENGMRLAKLALCQSIGIEYNDSVAFVDTLDTSVDPNLVHVNNEEALPQRDEYKLLGLNVEAQRLQKRMILGEALPSVAVGGGYLYNNFLRKDKFNAVAFFTVSIPISGWWETSCKLKQYEMKRRIAEVTRDNANELLLLQMQLAWNELTESYSQVSLSEEAVAEAEANVKLTADYFAAGMVGVSDLLQAQTALQQARDNLTDTSIAYKIKFLNYRQLTQP